MTHAGIYTVAEWSDPLMIEAVPTEDDLQLTERLRRKGALSLGVDWLHGGRVRVTPMSAVGVVRFSSFEVHIEPKLVGGRARLLRMLQYAGDITDLTRLSDAALPESGESLLELICLLLAEESARLVRRGLLRDYRSAVDELSVLRGRLRLRDQATKRFLQVDRLLCEYDDYDGNNPVNHLVAAGLERAARVARSRTLKRSLRASADVFDAVCQPSHQDPGRFEREIVYNRRNEAYRPAHQLSLLLLRNLGIDDPFTRTQSKSFSFLLDMNQLYERFVTRLVRDAYAEDHMMSVDRQVGTGRAIINIDTAKTYVAIRPDLVLTQKSDVVTEIPLDVKYKRYDARSVAESDIYQLSVYALTHQRDPGPEAPVVLLYPSDDAASKVTRLAVRGRTGEHLVRLTAIGIDSAGVLDAWKAGHVAYADAVANMRALIDSTVPVPS